MTAPDLWNEWVEAYDVFISYARADNAGEPGMVTAFVEHLEADFARFSPSVPLKVFFDKRAILAGQYWQDVLRKGLRQSKVMIAFLSPAYFQSAWCRREWEEYLLVEQGRTYPGEALTPIFVVAPADLERGLPPAARDWWADLRGRNAVVEIAPYWHRGRDALQVALVAERVRRLEENIRQRLEHGRQLARVPRDLRGRNPNFVGRRRELAALRDALSRFEMVGLCAVHGVGGIGKSALAREYAYLFRREYLGGQFEIDLSATRDLAGLQSQLVRIARDYLGADVPPALPEPAQYERARAAFDRRPPGETVLLILDNLEEAAASIIGQANRHALPSAEKVHVLVTTRAEPRALGGLTTVALDLLEPGEALDLLFRYRAFARNPEDPDYLAAREGRYALADHDPAPADAEWKAALAIVHRLGRHSLAVALVGAYLGSYPDLDYRRFAAELAEHGIGLALDAAGGDDRVRALIAHPVPLIGELFARSVARLSPLALRALEYAALLPPDRVPLAWLKELVTADADMAAHLSPRPFQPPPWEETLRTLAGLDYLKGGPYAQVHRVLQEVVRRRMEPQERERREDAARAFVERQAFANRNETSRYAGLQEIEAAVQFVAARLAAGDPRLGRSAAWLVGILQEVGKLGTALAFARASERILKPVAEADPTSAERQRDLAVAQNWLGEVHLAAGDLAAARRYFEGSRHLAQALAAADPAADLKQRDLAVALEKLGKVSATAGDLVAARRSYADAFRICQALAEADPASAEKQRDRWVTAIKLGEVSMAVGDLAAAHNYFGEAMRVSQALAEADPTAAEKQRDLAASHNWLGNVSAAAGDVAAAHRFFEGGHRIARALAEADPASAEKQRDLAIALAKLGGVSMAAGDLATARRHFADGLCLHQALAAADPTSAQKQRDLWVAHWKMAGLLERQRDTAARDHWRQALAILNRMDAADFHLAPADRQSLDWLRRRLGKA